MQGPAAASDSPESTDRVARLALATFLTASGAVIYLAFFAGFPIDHDAAVMLQVGDILLHGGVPYRDIIEITPPMAPALHMLPLLLSEFLPVPVPVAFHLFVTLALAFSCWQVWALLGRRSPPLSVDRRLLFLSAWLTASLSLQFTLDYGQREHLFALMLAPWLLCRMLRYEGVRLPVGLTATLGLAAGPCFLIKPFFLAVVIGVELALLVRARKFRPLVAPEAVLAFCWGVAYFIYLAALPEDARRELFDRLIPTLMRHYNAYWGDFFHTENLVTYAWCAAFAAFAAAEARRLPANVRFHANMFVLTAALCFVAYWGQNKGWFYHHIPVRFFAIGALAYVLCSGPAQKASPRSKAAYGALFVMPVVCYGAAYYGYRMERTDYTVAMTAKIRQYAAPGDYVNFITTDVRRMYPAMIYAGVKLGSRYDIDFMLPMVYDELAKDPEAPHTYFTGPDQSEDERRYLQAKAEDIARYRPRLVAIETAFDTQALPWWFRINDYLETTGWRKDALADYRCAEAFENFLIFVPK